MSNTLKIVERVREHTETGTNYAVAKALGISQSNLDRILKGDGYLGDKAQRHAAKVLQLSFEDINALVNEDRAKSEPERAYWRSLCAESIRAIINASGSIAATLIAAAALNLLSANPAKANEIGLTADLPHLCIMRLMEMPKAGYRPGPLRLFGSWFDRINRSRDYLSVIE